MINSLLATAAYVTISFTGLSTDKGLENLQKGVIAEALRAIFQEPSAFIEENNDVSLATEKDREHFRVLINCESCEPLQRSMAINHKTLRFESIESSKNEFRIIFNLETVRDSVSSSELDHKDKLWILKGSIVPLRFAVRAEKKIDPEQLVKKEYFSIEACLKQMRCTDKNSYSTYQNAEEAIDSFQGMKTRKVIMPSQIINHSDLSRPLATIKGQPVRITLRTQSGIEILTSGTALESGFIGDNIEVRVKATSEERSTLGSKSISAIITSEGQVLYER